MSIDFIFWLPVMIGGAVAGGSTGMLGTYIVGMRIPFLGIVVSHAALAGAVFGALFGLTGQWLLAPAMGSAVVAALVLGLINLEKIQVDTNVVMGVLFSVTMGLAFLGIGMFSRFDRSDSEALSLLWGSLTFCSWSDVAWMSGIAVAQVVFIVIFRKEMKAIMFSREIAAASGVNVKLIWTVFLVLTSAVLTVNFKTVGGLMIYSLMTNPAAAAFQLVNGHNRTLVVSMIIGAISGLGGFLIALFWGVPSGAAIVLLSSALLFICYVIARGCERSSNSDTRSGSIDMQNGGNEDAQS